VNLPDTIFLPPLSALYSGIIKARAGLYRRNLLRVSKLHAPVISVGNITTGGTGKTPLVEWIARLLADQGKRPCILTRGYGRLNSKMRVVVSDGKKLTANEAAAGDEAFLLARSLEGLAAVICDADRVAAGQWALAKLGVDVFILDDGFQHLRLIRDLDIVTIDATNPWGGGHLLPYGRLREPLKELSRAGCIVVTRTNQAKDLQEIQRRLQEITDNPPVFLSSMITKRITPLDHSGPAQPESPVAAFCGVGNSESFFEQLEHAGFEVKFKRQFADHHRYSRDEIKRLVKDAENSHACSLITTAKDAVKLSPDFFDLPCYVLEIEISIADNQKLIELIKHVVTKPG